jgi:hypothetical protein
MTTCGRVKDLAGNVKEQQAAHHPRTEEGR